jgi:hypothetical protein
MIAYKTRQKQDKNLRKSTSKEDSSLKQENHPAARNIPQ